MSPRRLPTVLALLLALSAPSSAAAALSAGQTALVSGQPDLATQLATPDGDAGAEGPGSWLSDDGRFVVFSGPLAGLSNLDDDRFSSVFVKDRQTGAVTLASRGPGAALTADSEALAISDDGTRVLFTTSAQVAGADTNTGYDLYVRDLTAGTTTLVSRVSGAGAVALGGTDDGVLSGDGNHVAFGTNSGAVDPAVTDANGLTDVYVRDVPAGTTTLVSRGGAATAVGGYSPSISDNGVVAGFVTDTSLAGGLDINGVSDLYVRVVPAPSSTQLASRTNGGGGAATTGQVGEGVISGDGSTAAWSTTATDLGDGDATSLLDIHRSVLGSGVTSLVSRSATGAIGDMESYSPSISDNGQNVAFISSASNLDALYPDTNGGPDAFVRRTASNETELSTRLSPAETQLAAGLDGVSLSGGGTALAIAGDEDIAPDLDPRFDHVIVRDTGVFPRLTQTVSRPAGTAPIVNAGGDATPPSANRGVSADGRYVVFSADQPGLTGVAPGVLSVYRRDLVTGAVVLVATNASPRGISDDGGRVLFGTQAALDGADTNAAEDLYVRDIAAGASLLVNRADGAAGAGGNAGSFTGEISGDGRRVAYVTNATNLGNGDASAVSSVHVRDLDARRTLLGSRGQGPGGAANTDDVGAVSISADGRVIAFGSKGAGYGDGGSGALLQIHVRDLETGINTLASTSAAGAQGNGTGVDPSLSADGRVVSFGSQATNLTPDDTDTTLDVLVKNLATGSVTLASRADGPSGANSTIAATRAWLSGDGSRVVFRSTEATLDATGVATGTFLYLRDLTAGTTRLVSRANGAGGGALRGVGSGSLSRDGSCALFRADHPASGLQLGQALVRAVRDGCPAAAAGPAGGGAAAGGGGSAGSGTTPAARDRTAPRICAVSISPSRVRRGKPFTVRFSLSEAARVRVRMATVRTGRRVGTQCRASTPKLRKRRKCELLVTRTSVTRALKAGAVSVRVGAKPGGRRLATGKYVLLLTATDAAGNRSAEARVRVTVRR